MNRVVLVGFVSDKPFRPGGGPRAVVKIRARNYNDREEGLEFDAFGQTAVYAQQLRVGDRIAIDGRLENRVYTQDGDEVNEIRCVADRIELVAGGDVLRL